MIPPSEVPRRRAIGIANLMREGKTQRTIGLMFGVSQTIVSRHLAQGCPSFMPPRVVRKPKRPAWSYPDAVTLAIVAEARREMELHPFRSFREANV